jgi:hypothetical protein
VRVSSRAGRQPDALDPVRLGVVTTQRNRVSAVRRRS